MQVWINGPFGVGKTTTANRLRETVPGWRIFDPETVGYMLRANVGDLIHRDFQDLPPWRTLVPRVFREVADLTRQHLISVQTVLRPSYWDQLQAGLVAEGLSVRHVVLDVDPATLRWRIEHDERASKAEPGEVAPAFVGYLSDQASESRRWPDDREVQHAILDLPLYRLLTRGRLRMMLEAIEDSLRGKFAEESHVTRGGLTIEHVLPQAWQEHWPLPDDTTGVEAELDRERLLHSLGNLTLVNGRLNPALSHGAWETKREMLGTHTVLHLNKELLQTYGGGEWSEATIRQRGAALADQVLQIWPSGSAASQTIDV